MHAFEIQRYRGYLSFPGWRDPPPGENDIVFISFSEMPRPVSETLWVVHLPNSLSISLNTRLTVLIGA